MTYTEEELEALAAAAGVEWAEHRSNSGSEYWVWLQHHKGMSSGKTRREAMNIYWNRYINGEVGSLR